ncbi:MAG: flippase [Candidatus Kapaibacterium sp.]
MSSSKQIIKNLFSMSVAELAGKGLAVVFSIYLIKIIGPENNGALTIAKASVQAVLVFVLLGFDQVGIREIARDKNRINTYVGSIVTLRVVIAIITYALLFAFFEYALGDVSEKTKIATYIYGIMLLSNSIQLNWVFQAVERMHIIAVRSILVNVLNLIGLIIFVRSEDDFFTAVWIIVLSFFVNVVWMIIYYIRYYGFPVFKYSKSFIKSLSYESMRVGFVFILLSMYNIITVQFLSIYHGDYQTGIYGAAFQIIVFSLIPATIMQGAFFPQLSQMSSIEDRNSLMSKFMMLNLLSGVLISFSMFTFSDSIIWILGDKYEKTSTLIKILSPTILIQYISSAYFSTLISWKREKLVMFANLAGFIAVIAINILLVPHYGFYGAAIATVVCELSVLIVIMIIFYNTLKRLHLETIKPLFLISLPLFGFAFLALDYGINTFIVALFSLIVYIFLVVKFKILNIQEIRNVFRR